MFRLLSGNKLKDKIRVEKISREFNLMSMNQMASYHVFLENYNIINFGASQKIKEKLLPSNPNSSHLRVPLFRKESCRSFSFYAARLWNTLPLAIRLKGMPKSGLDKNSEDKRLNSFKADIKDWITGKQDKKGVAVTLPGVPFR